MTDDDDTTVRPVFRVAAGFVATLGWYGVAALVYLAIKDPDARKLPTLLGLIGLVPFTLVMTFAAMRGRVPRWVLRLTQVSFGGWS